MIKCKICGYTPCFPWAIAHEKDFAKEIEKERKRRLVENWSILKEEKETSK